MSRRKLVREIQAGKVVYRWEGEAAAPQQRFRAVLFSYLVRLVPWVNATLLTGAAALVLLTLWVAIQTLINPDAGFWLNQFFADSKKPAAETDPKPLATIQAQLQPLGYRAGHQQSLDAQGRLTLSSTSATVVLMPLFGQPANCATTCEAVVKELRLYRGLQLPPPMAWWQPQQFFRLQQRLAVVGPLASQIVSANYDARLGGVTGQRLHYQRLSDFENPSHLPGQWFALRGSHVQANTIFSYGTLFYFEPHTGQLTRQIAWHSSQGEAPSWRDITGGGLPELVVNQTVGLEPEFEVYTLERSMQGRVQLQLVSLAKPALDHPNYRAALALARGGLWSPALASLEKLLAEKPPGWTAAADAQVSLIRLHAQISQTQAQQPAMNLSEQIWSQLLNGDWELALQRLEQNPQFLADVQLLLQRDSGRLQQRLDTVLGMNPKPSAAVLWQVLLIQSQKGQKEATNWLAKQSLASGESAKLQARWRKILQPPKPQPTPTTSPSPDSSNPSSSPNPESSPPPALESSPKPTTAPSNSPRPKLSPIEPVPTPEPSASEEQSETNL